MGAPFKNEPDLDIETKLLLAEAYQLAREHLKDEYHMRQEQIESLDGILTSSLLVLSRAGQADLEQLTRYSVSQSLAIFRSRLRYSSL